MEICPAQAHRSLQSCVRQGFPPINTLGCIGIQLTVTGTQGTGVRTPIAAAVAAATAGFVIVLHIPKGPTFAVVASMIVAAGFPSANTI